MTHARTKAAITITRTTTTTTVKLGTRREVQEETCTRASLRLGPAYLLLFLIEIKKKMPGS